MAKNYPTEASDVSLLATLQAMPFCPTTLAVVCERHVRTKMAASTNYGTFANCRETSALNCALNMFITTSNTTVRGVETNYIHIKRKDSALSNFLGRFKQQYVCITT